LTAYTEYSQTMAKRNNGYQARNFIANQEIKMEKIGEASLVGPLQESACLAKMRTRDTYYVNYMFDLTFISGTISADIGFSQ